MEPRPSSQQGYRGSNYVHRRRRAASTTSQRTPGLTNGEPIHMNSTPMGPYQRPPPPIAVPYHLDIASKRNLPRGPAIQHLPFQLSELRDPLHFKHVVINDSQGVFVQLTDLLQQNQELKNQVKSISEDLESSRKDFASLHNQCEKLYAAGTSKETVLWEYIRRLQGGLFEGAGLEGAKERFEKREKDKCVLVNESTSWSGTDKMPMQDLLLPRNNSPETTLSVLSGMSAEVGCGSPVKSVTGSTTTSLDPNADAFFPRASSSAKPHIGAPEFAYKPIVTHQTADTDTEFKLFVKSLPPKLSNICPISMTQESQCPIVKCKLDKLCNSYNNQGCVDPNCQQIHEYRTYFYDIPRPKSKHTTSKPSTTVGNFHQAKNVHNPVGPGHDEQWQIRRILAALIPAHLDGRY